MKFTVKQIQPNPFRQMEHYPIQRDKVEALRESLRATGYWDNMVARLVKGKPQIAYGHHRLAALKEEYGSNYKAGLIIKKLDDAAMIKIMAYENMEEWSGNMWVEMETVKVIVTAYAEGKIELSPPDSNTGELFLRYAPSFITGTCPRAWAGDFPYTAKTVAEFMGRLKADGRAKSRIIDILSALELIEEGLLNPLDFEGLSSKEIGAVVEQARKTKRQYGEAARAHEDEAEQASHEAETAEKNRKKAEEKRRKAEKQAAVAKDRREKAEAREVAKQYRKLEQDATKAQKKAKKRQKEESRKQKDKLKEGRRQAAKVGRAVGTSIKKGEIGYSDAHKVTSKLLPKQAGPPKHVDAFTSRLAKNIGKILDPNTDRLVPHIQELIEAREHINPLVRADIAQVLENVAKRAFHYSQQFRGGGRGVKSLPSGGTNG